MSTRVDLTKTLHPQSVGKSELIEMFKYVLYELLIYFGYHCDQLIPLVKFAYNNSYHFSIDMASSEAFYRIRYRYLSIYSDSFKVRPWGTDLSKIFREGEFYPRDGASSLM